jgi:glycosyltransferase involved in cell wall biosynthesis
MILGPAVAESQNAGTLAMPTRTTFVLPGRNRSGGVRVTMEMANRLRDLGYPVRIVYRRPSISLLRRGQIFAGGVLRRLQGAVHDDWLASFRGRVESFAELDELDYEPDEVVIAVGSKIIPELQRLTAPVNRVRFCHGFHHFLPERMEAAWRFATPTLTVSQTLIPGLLAYDPSSPIWLVPNGITLDDYFDEHRRRDGIGTILSHDPAKSPEDVLRVLSEIPRRIPPARRYVFGERLRPRQLSPGEYRRLPSLQKAREMYNRSKIWLLLSRAEGLPGPVLEAMACGTAVISTDNEGSREIIRHEENGLLFPIGDTGACLNAIERLWHDDELRNRLVKRGLETAGAFSWDRAVQRMRMALDDLVTGRRLYVEPATEAASCA